MTSAETNEGGVVAIPSPGTTIGGKYRLDRVVGEGGMGTVFESTHLGLERRVAIKVLSSEALLDDAAYERFKREARIASSLSSPHVAHVLDVDHLPNGLPYIVMELLVGSDLSDELAKTGPLPVPVAVDYVLQALDALEEAHASGVIHRDIKPANLFLCRAGEGERRMVKVLDFGISKAVDDRAITQTFDAFGTPQYMSPEQIRASKHVDVRADLWSLGVVLYECVTGRAPFVGTATNVIASIVADPVPPPRSFRPELPDAFEAVLLRALDKIPGQRFQGAREMADALEPFAGDDRAPWAPRSSPRPFALATRASLVDASPLPPDVTPITLQTVTTDAAPPEQAASAGSPAAAPATWMRFRAPALAFVGALALGAVGVVAVGRSSSSLSSSSSSSKAPTDPAATVRSTPEPVVATAPATAVEAPAPAGRADEVAPGASARPSKPRTAPPPPTTTPKASASTPPPAPATQPTPTAASKINPEHI